MLISWQAGSRCAAAAQPLFLRRSRPAPAARRAVAARSHHRSAGPLSGTAGRSSSTACRFLTNMHKQQQAEEEEQVTAQQQLQLDALKDYEHPISVEEVRVCGAAALWTALQHTACCLPNRGSPADPLCTNNHSSQFRKLGYEAVDMICDYMQSVEGARVVPDVQVGSGVLVQSVAEATAAFAEVERLWGRQMLVLP